MGWRGVKRWTRRVLLRAMLVAMVFFAIFCEEHCEMTCCYSFQNIGILHLDLHSRVTIDLAQVKGMCQIEIKRVVCFKKCNVVCSIVFTFLVLWGAGIAPEEKSGLPAVKPGGILMIWTNFASRISWLL